MNAALQIFETLQNPQLGFSPQGWLEHHCQTIWNGVERVHFDFKQKQDRRIATLGDSDKKNLAKAVSGFANSSGGVLIWGVDDAGTVKPISDARRFLDSLLQMCFQVTEPSVAGIDGALINADSSSQDGFIVLYIPESPAFPHRAILQQPEVNGHYFMRSGSSFLKASHVQLEDMFGRRPKPKLELSFRTSGDAHEGGRITVHIEIKNVGRTLAKFPYAILSVNKPYYISAFGYDGNGRVGLARLKQDGILRHSNSGHERGYQTAEYGSQGDIVIHSGATLTLTQINGEGISNESIENLKIRFCLAAEGLALTCQEHEIPVDELRRHISAK